jgi:hypothetical protein
MKTFLHAALCAASIASALGQSQSPSKPILPMGPPELLRFLPAPPAGWEMKESRAKSFYNEWLVCQASRQFTLLSPAVPSQKPAPPAITNVRLTDTGMYPILAADFEAFKPGKYGNMESLYLGSLPARKAILPDGERLRVLLKGRFIVEVETHHQQPNSSATWLRQFDFTRLESVPSSGIEKLPNPLRVMTIDELNPKLNTSYEVNWSTDQQLEAARNRKR